MGGELLGVSGGGMPGGKGWGIDAWPGVGMAVLRQINVGCWEIECFGPFPIPPVPLLSLYFPYPSDQLSPSHTSHTPLCPLFPTITTLVHPRLDAESCHAISHPVAGC